MPNTYKGRPTPPRPPIVVILSILIAVLAIADIAVISLCLRTGKKEDTQKPTASPIETIGDPTETEAPPAPVSTATILSTGDLLMHKKVINSGKQEDGSYDFESIFRYIAPYTGKADYAVANLETTLCGTDKGFAYSGNPKFNCPDALVDSARDAGFDMLLTANNHSMDTTIVGYKRTLEVVREKGLATLGTYLTADEQKWTMLDINGIKIGVMCFCYSDGFAPNGNPVLNYNEVPEPGLLSYFTYDKLPEFYAQVQTYLDEMKAAGVEATLVYMHWGEEYKLSANKDQQAMAQKLCDMGIDAIVGSHPHVLEPVDLLQSTTDPGHATVVLYSLGNAVSNQRKEEMTTLTTGETEDGALFSVTFAKYPDGTVCLDAVELIPTWVNMHANSGKTEYNIIPLDVSIATQWQERFGLTDVQILNAKASLNRTNQIVSQGLEKVQSYLSGQKEAREAPASTDDAA
ncbi:MAG: CapA family protein [Oscillospiraceae bacterium]|nr:CapA family protein [Oscillospiraceae bacterium]